MTSLESRPSARPRGAAGAHVQSVQVGRAQDHRWLGKDLRTSIFKSPVHGPVAARGVNLEGDEQADTNSHGGPDKAAYAYAREDEDWWAAELGRPVEPGAFGENLTTLGLNLRQAVIGETWRVGTALLQVSDPRTPCWKLGLRMGDPRFPRAFAAARRPGVLLRILEEGVLQAGEPVQVTGRPDHGVTAETVTRIYYGDDKDLTPIHRATELAAHWRAWAEHRTVWHLQDEGSGA